MLGLPKVTANDSYRLRLEVTEKILCRIFYDHEIRRVGLQIQLNLMALGKSFKVFRTQFSLPFIKKMFMSAFSPSVVTTENVLICSAKPQWDWLSFWEAVRVKHSSVPSNYWPARVRKQTRMPLRYQAVPAVLCLGSRHHGSIGCRKGYARVFQISSSP